MDRNETKVLIVDDDEDMRATLSDFIGGMGVKVRVAADLAEAQLALGSETPPFDIVLADLKLPSGTGLDILKAAHTRSTDTLVSIVTGYASLETAMEAIRLGAYDYITKPFSLEEIGVQVRNMVGHIALTKENARLSMRLQELLAQINRLQAERLDFARFQEDMRREVSETNRKLDRLVAENNLASSGYVPGPAHGTDAPRPRAPIAIQKPKSA